MKCFAEQICSWHPSHLNGFALSSNEDRGQQECRTHGPHYASNDRDYRKDRTVACHRPEYPQAKAHEICLRKGDSENVTQQNDSGEQRKDCRDGILLDEYHRRDHAHQIDDEYWTSKSNLLYQE